LLFECAVVSDDLDVRQLGRQVPIEPQAPQRRWPHRRDKEIGLHKFGVECSALRRRLEIENDHPLIRGELLVPTGRGRRERITVWWLNLGHVGTEACQTGGRQRAGQVHGERHHANSGQRVRHIAPHYTNV
jgi:hypothetical protein